MNIKTLLTLEYGGSLEQYHNLGFIYREFELYKALSKKGIDFSLLTYGETKDLKYSDICGDIKIDPILKYIKSKNSIIQFIKFLLLPIKLKKKIKDVAIIKTNQMYGSLFACICKILYRKKIIIRCGYEWFRTFICDNAIKPKNYLSYLLNYIQIFLLELISYKIADGIILTNQRDIEFIIKKFRLKRKRSRIRHFYNFIDVNLFKPIDLKKKDKHILFVGRINDEKNLFNLIYALKDLQGFSLDIIGKGDLKEQLIRYANEVGVAVNFLGIIPNNQLPEVINQYPIFILPSFYEGNPKTLLEAMSCGIPCIGTDVIGINNIITDKENGYLTGISSNSLRDAIINLYNDEALREKIGKKGREFILNNCSLEKIVNDEYAFYKEILKK